MYISYLKASMSYQVYAFEISNCTYSLFFLFLFHGNSFFPDNQTPRNGTTPSVSPFSPNSKQRKSRITKEITDKIRNLYLSVNDQVEVLTHSL